MTCEEYQKLDNIGQSIAEAALKLEDITPATLMEYRHLLSKYKLLSDRKKELLWDRDMDNPTRLK